MIFKWGQRGSDSANDAFNVRLEVFVNEQGFSPDIEIDDIDNIAMHLTGYDNNGTPQCAARLFVEHGNVWHAGRIAVLKAHRGIGTGALVMKQLELMALQKGAEKIVLGAQFDKAVFYEKCGYLKTGKEFLDEGYLHIEMSLKLK